MRYGRSVPNGWLPVHSTDTEQEARRLLIVSCATNIDGEFVARELAEEQTLENLEVFAARLRAVERWLKKGKRK